MREERKTKQRWQGRHPRTKQIIYGVIIERQSDGSTVSYKDSKRVIKHRDLLLQVLEEADGRSLVARELWLAVKEKIKQFQREGMFVYYLGIENFRKQLELGIIRGTIKRSGFGFFL